jgi:hypothetical protein
MNKQNVGKRWLLKVLLSLLLLLGSFGLALNTPSSVTAKAKYKSWEGTK